MGQHPRLALLLAGLWALSAVGGLACNVRGGHSAAEVAGSDCVACHRDEYEAAVQPLHVQELPLDCETCHANDTWRPAAGSDHARYFALRGAHADAGCGGCHAGGFEPGVTPTACVDCHARDSERAARPDHAGLPRDCTKCHDESAFAPAHFEHAWPLVGEHAGVACAGCHGDAPAAYAGTRSACVDCHRADYEAALSPSHAGFSTACQTCHSPTGWRGAGASDPGFMHPWPLRGAHGRAACSGCHVGDPPVYAGTPMACVDCHGSQRATARVDHAGFSDDCASCHSEDSFTPAAFDHAWPLGGAHASARCGACHVGNPPVYVGTPTACVDCHGAERATASIDHAGFSEDCASCHSDRSFTPASFDHRWPLTGAHASATCAACHGDSPAVYAGTSKACIDCHRQDYDNSPFPGHDAFSTDCAACHTTTGFRPASGGHPEARFPTSGRHNYPCMDCHNAALGPNSRDNTDCVGCHDESRHARSRMDPKHSGVRGYPTGAAAANFCLDCHPGGRGD